MSFLFNIPYCISLYFFSHSFLFFKLGTAPPAEEGEDNDDDYEVEEEEVPPPPVVRTPPRHPNRRQRRQQAEPLVATFQSLSINKHSQKMFHYNFTWEEGLLPGGNGNTHDLRNRASIEMLLPGPTSIEQLLCSVISNGKQVK